MYIVFFPSTGLGYVVIADFGCTDVDNDPLTYVLTQLPADNTFEVDPISNQLRVNGGFYFCFCFVLFACFFVCMFARN
jgi:hypothetical protein